MNQNISKVGLGTVQWGCNYGISNNDGQTPIDEVKNILQLAKNAGISILDTASLYGTAESILGEFDLSRFRIVTKTPRFSSNAISIDHANVVIHTFHDSLSKLRVESLHGLLIHDVNDIFKLNGGYLIDALRSLKSQGLVSKIGVSIYDSNDLKKTLNVFVPDIVQLPFSVLDQRMLTDGTIHLLNSLGIEIHARSVFLQGLLLMDPASLPDYFTPWASYLSIWHNLCRDKEISPITAALNFPCSFSEISCSLVGVQNSVQLKDIIYPVKDFIDFDYQSLSCTDLRLIDPRRWPTF